MTGSLSILGLTKKAGKLEIGEDSCKIVAKTKKARLIISANDASENSIERAAYYASEANLPHIVLPYGKFELGNQVGRGSPGMLAITDVGLAVSFLTKLEAETPGCYSGELELLTETSERLKKRKAKTAAQKRNVGTGKRRKINE